MSMISWIKKDSSPNLILFIHGLNGGEETWAHDKVSFPGLLKDDPSLENSYDIAKFNYFTNFTNLYGNTKGIFSRIFGTLNRVEKNLPISELSELLKTEFELHLSDYENIIIIAHSMGGLIAKMFILNYYEETQSCPVTGFISLAVPHSGSNKANISKFISSNVQIKDLSALSDAITELSHKWANTEISIIAKYIYGTYDSIVVKNSAKILGSDKKDSIAVNEDHISIAKPKSREENIYVAVVKIIKEIKSTSKKPLAIQEFQDNSQYDDQVFVLKMVLADIDNNITSHAKSYFFNAEEARKIFTSDRDKKLLGELYKKVQEIYNQEQENYIANNLTSDQFVYRVHEKIMSQKDSYLFCILKELDGIHKKGMLHQLANKSDGSIHWGYMYPPEDKE